MRDKNKMPKWAFDFYGGVRYFYGLLHTTSGNLQGIFAIFVPKTNFAPRPSRILSTFRKKFPKQITGNLFKKLYIFVAFLTNFWYNTYVSPAEDYELWSRAIKVLKMANIPEVLLRYRWHSNNSSNSRSEKQHRVATEVQQNMLDFLTKDLNKQRQIKLTLCDDKRWFKIGLPLLSVAVSKTYIGVFMFGCIKIFSKKRLRK